MAIWGPGSKEGFLKGESSWGGGGLVVRLAAEDQPVLGLRAGRKEGKGFSFQDPS